MSMPRLVIGAIALTLIASLSSARAQGDVRRTIAVFHYASPNDGAKGALDLFLSKVGGDFEGINPYITVDRVDDDVPPPEERDHYQASAHDLALIHGNVWATTPLEFKFENLVHLGDRRGQLSKAALSVTVKFTIADIPKGRNALDAVALYVLAQDEIQSKNRPEAFRLLGEARGLVDELIKDPSVVSADLIDLAKAIEDSLHSLGVKA